MRRIDFNSKVGDKPQAAFVIFYSLDGQLWGDYPGAIDDVRNLTIPSCLMLNRFDGTVGFVGGKVDPGESLEETVRREVFEEIGYQLTSPIEPLVAHDIGQITTHAFCALRSRLELVEMQRRAIDSLHFGSEVTGVFTPHLIDYQMRLGKWGGISELIKTSMAPSVREELIHLLLRKNIFTEKELLDISLRSGFSLEKLLE